MIRIASISIFLLAVVTAQAQEPFGFVVINSEPANAEVFINGQPVGTTTHQSQLNVGQYRLVLKMTEYNDYEATFEIKENETTRLNIRMVSVYGSMNVNSTPDGARIILDGDDLELTTPAYLERIPQGRHRITLVRDLYSNVTEEVMVSGEETASVNLELSARFGIIAVDTRPDADILVDGQKVGEGFYTGRLSEGRHRITAQLENHHPQTQSITMGEGDERSLSFELKPVVGNISVKTDPLDAKIFIDGKEVGISPKVVTGVFAGDHKLKISKQGYGIIEKDIRVEEGRTLMFDEQLLPGYNSTITTDPEGAEVWVNEQAVGRSPVDVILSPGQNTIRVVADLYAEKEFTESVRSYGREFNYTLNRVIISAVVSTYPPGAEIVLGKYTFKTLKNRTQSLKLAAGTYDLSASLDKYRSYTDQLYISENRDINLLLEPEKYRTVAGGIWRSLIWPGSGVSYLKRGGGSWLIGLLGYGLLANSYVMYDQASKNYDLYLIANTADERSDLKNQWQKQLQMSDYSLYGAAAVWGIGLIWTALTPGEYKLYQRLRVNGTYDNMTNSSGLSLSYHLSK